MSPKTAIVTVACRSAASNTSPRCLKDIEGSPLITRLLFSLKRAGIESVLITVDEASSRHLMFLKTEPSLSSLNIDFCSAPKEKLSHGNSIYACRDKVPVDETFLLVTSDHLFDQTTLSRLASMENRALVLVDDSKGCLESALDSAVKVKYGKDGTVFRIGRDIHPFDAVEAGAFLLDAKLFECMEKISRAQSYFTLAHAMQMLASVTKVSYLAMKSAALNISPVVRSASPPSDTVVSFSLAPPVNSQSPTASLVRFTVRTFNVLPNSVLCVVGDPEALGKWDHTKALRLEATQATTSEGDACVAWSAVVLLPCIFPVFQYTYCMVDASTGQLLWWESARDNRSVNTSSMDTTQENDVDDGVLIHMDEKPCTTDSRWLAGKDDACLVLRVGGWGGSATDGFHSEGSQCPSTYAFDVEPLPGHGLEKSVTVNAIAQDGRTFIVTSLAGLSGLSVLVRIKDVSNSSQVGAVAITEQELSAVVKVGMTVYACDVIRPVLDAECKLLGHFRCSLLVATAFQHKRNSLCQAHRRLFRLDNLLTVGHRGMGNSRKQVVSDLERLARPVVDENTVLSFTAAANSGASFVEFDVQLTSDSVPIVYHDFDVHVNVSGMAIPVAVNRLTMAQLKGLGHNMKPVFDDKYVRLFEKHSDKSSKSSMKKRSQSHMELRELERAADAGTPKAPDQPWIIADAVPTLLEALELVPSHLGFNVEVKYPMFEDLNAAHSYFNLNHFVDCILQVVFDAARSRPIIFSSFDPNTCMLLQLKQAVYPVFFLTEGGIMPHQDRRCSSMQGAIDWAAGLNLAGIVADNKSILKDFSLVKEVHSRGLLLFTYGDSNSDSKVREQQVEHGVDAIILDGIANLHAG